MDDNYGDTPDFESQAQLDAHLRTVFEAVLYSEELDTEDARDCFHRFADEVDYAIRAGAVSSVVNGNGYRFPPVELRTGVPDGIRDEEPTCDDAKTDPGDGSKNE